MLHCDDQTAGEILKLINDTCSSKLGTVSAVIASSEGPIIYGGTCDKRYPQGEHVVIWQQGNHYVAIVHHTAMIDTSYEQTTSDKGIQGLEDEVFKLTMHQIHQLRDMRIVAERNGSYKTSLQTN